MRTKLLLLPALAVSAIAGLVFATPADASPKTIGTTEQNRKVVADSFDAWRDGRGGPYDLLADNAVWTITGNSLAGKTYPNKEAFISEVIRPFNARMRERLIPQVHRIYAEGDTVIVHFDARGIARDGAPYENTYSWILQLREGRIVRSWAWFDSKAFDDLWTRVQPQ